MKNIKGPLLLFLTAFMWGFCLVGQADGLNYMGPWSFTAARLTLGGVSLLILCLVLDAIRKKKDPSYDAIKEYKKAFKPALICVIPILTTIMGQQTSLLYTQVGKCAFITAFYIFLTPLFGFLIGRKVSYRIWIAVVLSMIGLFFITMSGGIDSINKGDMICLLAAIAYSIYILLVDKLGADIDSIKFSMIQFTICGLLCFPVAAILEPGQLTLESYIAGFVPIFALGVLSCGGGYTLQIIGQKYTEASVATMILSGETVFSLLGGFLILHEILKTNEYIGCAIMVVAILISVLPDKKKI